MRKKDSTSLQADARDKCLKNTMKIAIIGAGAAGLSAAKHCLTSNIPIDVLEATSTLGGTWNYSDQPNTHSSMYKNLHTNLPKELMSYEDFPYPPMDKSYLTQQQVLDYIHSYASKYQLHQHIKFQTKVVKVEPADSGQWRLVWENAGRQTTAIYSAVIVCNGHFSIPLTPAIPGAELFQGLLSHSHDFRTPDCYRNKRVLVIGAGPSGRDIARIISQQALKVFVSHKGDSPLELGFATEKPPVERFEATAAFFGDGSQEEVDAVLFCTGYHYAFPFLDGLVEVKDNCVLPLYKHVISIENPTLAFIGLPFRACPFPLFDVQVRFFLAFFNGAAALPAREDMLEGLRVELGRLPVLRKYHELGGAQGGYFEELTRLAGIRGVPPVIDRLFKRVVQGRNVACRFKVVDDYTWEEICE